VLQFLNVSGKCFWYFVYCLLLALFTINFLTMNIYVGNLNWNMTSEDLSNLFAPFGTVLSAKIVTLLPTSLTITAAKGLVLLK